ncbi:flagellar hook-associated protein 3 FlgL [Cognatiyoonia koreensis]|uniref:Flagellar hook-associated protein 3 FlgL n=1 Tax=Cognatiyoonia koreensis TaxID=364200 RepID=A0A1I0RLV7_9RHOB|nr:flagellin [Cognatiyoonia koreensis]SEW41405.1 flagellar hook-associated protein 3 FlgL [Cognatiyoonia koreensis]
MPIHTVGDMSQHFQSLRQTGRLKTDLNVLTGELSSQIKNDLTRSLGGDLRQLQSIDREITLLQGYQQAGTEIAQRLSFAQTTLAAIDRIRGNFMETALQITPESAARDIQASVKAGEAAFTEIATQLNRRLGERTIFGGADVARDPLAPPQEMLTSLRAATAGLTDQADIIAAVDDWFDDPAGGFATLGYQGDTGPQLQQRISADKTIALNMRADGAASVALLKGAAIAAMADENTVGLTDRTRAGLVQTSGQRMLSAADDLTAMRSDLGAAQASVDEAAAAHGAQLTAFQINRNELTAADPFDTASRLQNVQQQLEMHYTVTARLSQLSLVNYLR